MNITPQPGSATPQTTVVAGQNATTVAPAAAARQPQANNLDLLVAALIALNAVIWIVIPTFFHESPPRDVIEGYMWGREWVIATYKHPALPSWLIEASRIVTGGATDWPVYVTAQAITAGCLWLVYLTGKTIFGGDSGARIGACGALALIPIEHFSWMSPVFNHNLPQMLGWIAVVYLAWRAVEENRTLLWVVLGFAAAFSLYGKLSSVFLAVGIGVWFLTDHKARRNLLSIGPWLAIFVLACLLSPLVAWLLRNDLQPIIYAQSRTGDLDTEVAAKFFANVVLIQLPLLAVLAISRLLPGQPPKQLIAPTQGPDDLQTSARHARGLRYLLIVTVVPVLVPIVVGLVRGSGLRASWLSPAMNTAGLMFVALATASLSLSMVQRTARVATALGLATAALYVTLLVLPVRSGNPARVNWPSAEIAQRFSDIWQRETRAPLKIVAGDMWVAGLIGYRASTQPSLLTDGDFTISPWVTPARLRREGALVIWHDRGDTLPPSLAKLVERRPVQSEEFRAKRGFKTRSIVIRYVIVPPTQ